MYRRIPLIVLLLALAVTPARAGYEEGKAAFAVKDWVKAIAELRPAVIANDDRAMLLLARMYLEGRGVVVDPVEAMRLYRLAAEKHNPLAMLSIAGIYQKGIGYRKSPKLAAEWLGRAASLGHQPSALLYAIALFQGDIDNPGDMRPDPKASYKWLKIAGAMKQYPASTARAQELSKIVSGRLNSVEIAQMDKEAAAFKPLDPKALGPLPPLEDQRVNALPPAPKKDVTEQPSAP